MLTNSTRLAAPKVGRAIYELCNPIVRSYPIVAEQGTDYPFMVYRRTSVTPSSTKDRYNHVTTVSMELAIVTATYEEGVEISQDIWERIDKKCGSVAGIEISEIRVTSSSEDYASNAYVQRLQIEVDVTSIL